MKKEPKKVADLIEFLGGLSKFLPEDKRRQLQEENIPLKMERIRHTLTGTEPKSPITTPWPVKGEAATATRDKLKAIMARLKEKLAE